MKQKKNCSRFFLILLGTILAIFIVLLCNAIGSLLNSYFPNVLIKCSHILLICLLVFMIINLLVYAQIRHKYKLEKGQDIIEYIMQRKEEATKNYLEVEKKIFHRFRACFFYSIFMNVLFAFNIIAFSNTEALQMAILLSLIFIYILSVYFATMFIAFHNKKHALYDDLDKEEYQTLYHFVDTILKEEKIPCDFILTSNPSITIAIRLIQKKIEINIGALALRMLTLDELKAILLHECAHYHHQDMKRLKKWSFYQEKMEQMKNIHFLIQLFMYPFCNYTLFETQVYSLLTTIFHEQNADQLVLKRKEEQNLINGIAKLQAFSLYDEAVKDKNGFFINKEWAQNELFKEYQKFLQFYQENQKSIEYVLFHEITARLATHPSLKDRMQALHVNTIEIKFFDEHPLDFIFHQLDHFYDQRRKEEYQSEYDAQQSKYLEFIKRQEVYLQMINPSIEEKIKMLEDCMEYTHFKDALKIAYQIYEENPLQTRAKFYIGLLEIKMNLSAKGIKYLKDILDHEKNSEFYMDAYEILGQYFLQIGDEENINWLRSIAATSFDQNTIYQELASLNFKGPLFKIDEDEVYHGLLRLLAKEESIHFAIGVKKIKENMEVTHILIVFKENVSEDLSISIMEKIWAYLDAAPVDRQYVLNQITPNSIKTLSSFIIYQNEE